MEQNSIFKGRKMRLEVMHGVNDCWWNLEQVDGKQPEICISKDGYPSEDSALAAGKRYVKRHGIKLHAINVY